VQHIYIAPTLLKRPLLMKIIEELLGYTPTKDRCGNIVIHVSILVSLLVLFSVYIVNIKHI
jgi:hypothetical protein